jgi:hypothetical protein
MEYMPRIRDTTVAAMARKIKTVSSFIGFLLSLELVHDGYGSLVVGLRPSKLRL